MKNKRFNNSEEFKTWNNELDKLTRPRPVARNYFNRASRVLQLRHEAAMAKMPAKEVDNVEEHRETT